MKKYAIFIVLVIASNLQVLFGQKQGSILELDFCVDTLAFKFEPSDRVDFPDLLSQSSLQTFYKHIEQSDFQPIITALLKYKEQHHPDDWLYYQLIRKAAQQISPKHENYNRYTLYKWFLLAKSGYDVMLSSAGNVLLFYIHSNENIYNIPVRIKNGKQYVCLNYHDFKHVDLNNLSFSEVPLYFPGSSSEFSYKLTQLPDFKPAEYVEKEIGFTYYESNYQYKVKLNPQVTSLFENYPVVDYASYFNVPLSKETYASLIPALRKNLEGLNTRNGVDYLMHFTRNAFSFSPDTQIFGGEKRLTAEQTLFYGKSDCEDRVGLFFCLVKELYNLPMIVLSYPNHVTIAVQFKNAVGRSVLYNGRRYSVCEPTPQKQDLAIGQIPPYLRSASFEVVYAYEPR